MAPPPAAAMAGIAALVHRKRACDVDVEQVRELVLGQLGDRLGDLDAGVVDEAVEAPELCDGGSHSGVNFGGGPYIAAHRDGAVAELRGCSARAVNVDVGDRDARPAGGQSACNCQPDAAPAAGDKRPAAG